MLNPQEILMYNEYFQTMRDYLLHIQNLLLLLVTACVYIYFKSSTKKIKWIASITGVIGLINLIIGLSAFSKLLKTILAVRTNPSDADLMAIGCYVWTQSIIGFLMLICLIYCVIKGRYAQ